MLEQVGLVVEPLSLPPLLRQEADDLLAWCNEGPRKLPCWAS